MQWYRSTTATRCLRPAPPLAFVLRCFGGKLLFMFRPAVHVSFFKARSGGRRSWGSKPPSVVVTAETGTQTGDGEGVKHALVQAGDGRLLSEAELRDECNQRELRVRVRDAVHTGRPVGD